MLRDLNIAKIYSLVNGYVLCKTTLSRTAKAHGVSLGSLTSEQLQVGGFGSFSPLPE